MKIIIRPQARRDLESHWTWIARDNLPAADALLAAAEIEFGKIAAHPDLLGHEMNFRRHAGVRSRVVPGFPYLVFYVVNARQVEIKRILHGSRHLPKFFRH